MNPGDNDPAGKRRIRYTRLGVERVSIGIGLSQCLEELRFKPRLLE